MLIPESLDTQRGSLGNVCGPWIKLSPVNLLGEAVGHISSPLCDLGHHVGSLKSATVEVSVL
jgi:hypothetical protein